MSTKAIITSVVDDHKECDTMEQFERDFGLRRLCAIMKDRDDYFVGGIVSSDTPVGYVEEEACPIVMKNRLGVNYEI